MNSENRPDIRLCFRNFVPISRNELVFFNALYNSNCLNDITLGWGTYLDLKNEKELHPPKKILFTEYNLEDGLLLEHISNGDMCIATP